MQCKTCVAFFNKGRAIYTLSPGTTVRYFVLDTCSADLTSLPLFYRIFIKYILQSRRVIDSHFERFISSENTLRRSMLRRTHTHLFLTGEKIF